MRQIEFTEWKEQKSRMARARLRTDKGRETGNRPRDPAKERLLSRIDKARWVRYIESGKLVILGPRLWKWRIDF